MRLVKGFLAATASLAVLAASPGLADEHRWTHFGLRPLGMGNAFVAVADDYNALFYNPAGLARLKSWDGEFLNPAFEIARHTVQTIRKVSKLGSGSAGDISQMLSLFQDEAGHVHHVASYLTPHLVFKHFGIGLGLDFSAGMVAHSDVNIEFNAGLQVVAPLSYARSFLEDRLSVGATVKLLTRIGVDNAFTLASIDAFSADDGKNEDEHGQKLDDFIMGGRGYGVDLGLLFTPIPTMAPTLGLSITDLAGSPYTALVSKGKDLAAPKPRLPAINTGVSIRPWEYGRMYLLLAADSHMINQPLHYSHKFNLGAEWGIGEVIKLQAGLKEGYATGGIQLDVGLLNIRAATYVVDHGPVVALDDKLAERRYAIQLKLLI